ncbi:hypothetical protein [Mycobacterium parmense]|uniref:Uncharacterized protein n=1 Tax=Mycobacterium parmense TaxID=185642 RepID=A0A7I7YW67_9MYCO|nr:hypothetical protein [Mycobacterium parmense]MCV7351311.1 hypothetical protein [Mycobacterium parmense]ORW60836.1 hypothetical protein AWC20_07835 [Mycobacterium parmense]BBZ45233.1 hypothetical protein MPRM_25140 [Mycobacterium parmense]
MTTSVHQAEKLEIHVREALDDLCKRFSENAIGGGWHPRPGEYHRTRDLKTIREDGHRTLIHQLRDWSDSSTPVEALTCLWLRTWALWDESLAYHTLRVVQKVAEDFVDSHESADEWQRRAMLAMRDAMSLINMDADVFKQINLSSAEGLKQAATKAVESTATIESALNDLGSPSLADSDRTKRLKEDLDHIAGTAHQNHVFYKALACAAEALIEFERWLAVAPRHGSADGRPGPASSNLPSSPGRRELLNSVNDAIGAFRSARRSLGDLILERSEPWEQLLTEILEIIESESADVFVPRRVQIRYCYPFAVGRELGPDDEISRRPEQLVKNDFDKALKCLGISAKEPEPLTATEFFTRGPGHYGGVRVELQSISFRNFRDPHLAGVDGGFDLQDCRVWLDLSEIGNHCLCIEPAPLSAPLPHLVYRAVRAGSPFSLGETVVLRRRGSGTEPSSEDADAAWDDLHLFSQDVIAALAYWYLDPSNHGAGDGRAKRHSRESAKTSPPDADPSGTDSDPRTRQFERGHLHEVVVVRTDKPLGREPEKIAHVLDGAVGGKILLRSIQRGATTLEEWVRYPPLPKKSAQDLKLPIEGIPEMGLAGDWCAHTGETTVFGIVAAPSWQSDAWVEAAQFVSSWTPLLRLWNKRLQYAVEEDPLAPDHSKGKRAQAVGKHINMTKVRTDITNTADTLRQIERRVRLHLMQIRAEDLCATMAHRRFLDQLLEMGGLNRLQSELDAQLEAAERLTDWLEERIRRNADDRRQFLLGVIAAFTLFGVAAFLSLANETHMHQSLGFIELHEGVWEDWLVLGLFLVFAGYIFFFFGGPDWVRRTYRRLRKSRTLAEDGSINGD